MAGDVTTGSVTPRQGLTYGALALPLGGVALPLYVMAPPHYAEQYGMSLAWLGAALLVCRLLDALIDPAMGRWIDQRLNAPGVTFFRTWRLQALLAVCSVLGFAGVFMVPDAMTQARWLGGWFLATVTLTTVAFSAASTMHQAWGVRLGGDARVRTQWVAWREGLALLGVILANVVAAQAGHGVWLVVLAISLVLALVCLWRAPWQAPAPSVLPPPLSSPAAHALSERVNVWQPWRSQVFRRLLGLFALNGLAAAIPATLVVFFVKDVLQRPDALGGLLALYFVCGALSVPAWTALARRIGPSRAWFAGMLAQALVFVSVWWTGPGDVAWFALVCVGSGLMLGADLALPGALLSGVIQRHASLAQSAMFTGWWQTVSKLNLALAAGLTLPALQWLGYRMGVGDADSQALLKGFYGLLPCAVKALAAWVWWQWWRPLKEE